MASEIGKIDLDNDLVRALEKALFLARNGKIKAFTAVYMLDTSRLADAAEIVSITPGYEVSMTGLLALLSRDVLARMPVWEDFPKGQNDAG